MLFFIILDVYEYLGAAGFNTSHVILYRDVEEGETGGWMFQYISCYSLSLKAPVYSSRYAGFNTSHVILYPVED